MNLPSTATAAAIVIIITRTISIITISIITISIITISTKAG